VRSAPLKRSGDLGSSSSCSSSSWRQRCEERTRRERGRKEGRVCIGMVATDSTHILDQESIQQHMFFCTCVCRSFLIAATHCRRSHRHRRRRSW
jgi:hypothetical protein